jgi:prepilin-type N-terminal cleavage/methylation domain-containing protein
MKLFVWGSQRGDTLIEVTIALAILAMVLAGSTAVAVKAFQVGQTGRERTAIVEAAQAQMEAVRSFRDGHTWDEFLNGSPTPPSYNGVLSNLAGGITCNVKATLTCLHMVPITNASGTEYQPASGGMLGSVPTSFIEIAVVPELGSPTEIVDVTVSYGFISLGGSRTNTGHITTQLTNVQFIAAATPPPAIPPSGPPTCSSANGPNLIPNGDFTSPAGPGGNPNVLPSASFTSDIPNRGPGVYPDDGAVNGTFRAPGGFSIENGTIISGVSVRGYLFNGDNSIPGFPQAATSHYLYSNPLQGKYFPFLNPFKGTIWRSAPIAVQKDTPYKYTVYFDNLFNPSAYHAPGWVNPHIQMMADGTTLLDQVIPESTPPRNGPNWQAYSGTYRTGVNQTITNLIVNDIAGSQHNDDFGMTALSLYKCNP